MNKKVTSKHWVIICFVLIILLFVALGFLAYFKFYGPKNNEVKRVQSIYDSGFNLTSCEEITEQDIYELCKRIRDKNPEEFDVLLLVNKFHGHLGIANIYGAKQALYAKQLLGGQNYMIKVLSEAGTTQPMSCFNDGVQAAINATFGRNLIRNVDDPTSSNFAATYYYQNKWVRIETKPEFVEKAQGELMDLVQKYSGDLNDDYFKEVRGQSLKLWEDLSYLKPEDIFTITDMSWKIAKPGCEDTDANIQKYYDDLIVFVGSHKDKQEILDYLGQNECIINPSVTESGGQMEIDATWDVSDRGLNYKVSF
ncbi:MAG TPA: formylmethanofuran dehydrogenase subunit E family protein [Candidatus Staskawiczbacteria bacterium]|nr:formylmethanofuran dehydrogenase subunit E family protein [Candidatus Staskawiczbacteria bacterium]